MQTKADRATKAKQLEARVQAMIASGRYDEAMKMERQLNNDDAVARAKEIEAGDFKSALTSLLFQCDCSCVRKSAASARALIEGGEQKRDGRFCGGGGG